MERKILEITRLDAGYGKHAVLKDVQFSVSEGQVLAILGFNGTGKSTLLRTICGLQSPLQGKVHIFDKDLHAMHVQELSRNISVVLSGRGEMVQTLYVYEVLELARSPYQDNLGRLNTQDNEIIQRVIDDLHIGHLVQKRLYALSDGEAQKVSIARALVQETPMILLDEPTSHLDMHHKLEVFSLIRQLARNGKTIVFTSHEVDMALEIADHALLVGEDGNCAFGETERLLDEGLVQKYFEHGLLRFDVNTKRFTYTL